MPYLLYVTVLLMLQNLKVTFSWFDYSILSVFCERECVILYLPRYILNSGLAFWVFKYFGKTVVMYLVLTMLSTMSST